MSAVWFSICNNIIVNGSQPIPRKKNNDTQYFPHETVPQKPIFQTETNINLFFNSLYLYLYGKTVHSCIKLYFPNIFFIQNYTNILIFRGSHKIFIQLQPYPFNSVFTIDCPQSGVRNLVWRIIRRSIWWRHSLLW